MEATFAYFTGSISNQEQTMPRRFYETPSPARLGRIALTGVFCAVALMLAARWFVAADYQSISVGDTVTPQTVSHGGGSWTVESIDDSGVARIVNNATGEHWERDISSLNEK